jgi:hypothetical protein
MHGIDPLAWATDVIRKLQDGWPRSRLDELLPDAWTKAPSADAATLRRRDAATPQRRSRRSRPSLSAAAPMR